MSDVEMTPMNIDENYDAGKNKEDASASEDGEINDSDSDDGPSGRNIFKSKPDKVTMAVGKSKISLFDAEGDAVKLEQRKNRFQLEFGGDKARLEVELNALYETFGIVSEEDIRHARFDTICVYGTEKMNTNDVFDYFYPSHKPIYLEWINSDTCNVIWKDDISAARAMVYHSKKILYEDECERKINDQDEKMDTTEQNEVQKLSQPVRLQDLPVAPPPGRWRVGPPHPKAESIYLRFANKSDKKASGKEIHKVYSKKFNHLPEAIVNRIGIISEKSKNPWGELCETWGVYDSQEVFGVEVDPPVITRSPAIRAERRNIKDRIGSVISELKTPAVERHGEQRDISSRLGKRINAQSIDIIDDSESQESTSSDEEWTSKSKIPRMRMHADDEVEKVKKTKPVSLSSRQWDDEISLNTITVKVKNENIIGSEKGGIKGRLGNLPQNSKRSSPQAKSDLRSRLGQRRDSFDSESEESVSENRKGRSSIIKKVPTQKKTTVASTVWSRLDISKSRSHRESVSGSDSESEIQSVVQQTQPVSSKRPGFDKVGIRSRLGKKNEYQRSPLRIEVDNELCIESDT